MFSSGILVLALVSAVIVIVFRADEIAMLPLYALGVMLCFSLSQAGMFHLMGRIAHLKPGESMHTQVTEIHFESNAHRKRIMNAIGAVVTFGVFLVLALTKFMEGAWIVALLIPGLVVLFYMVHRHYDLVAAALSTEGLTMEDITAVADVVVVPIADIHRGTVRAIEYAQRLSTDVRVVTIITFPAMEARLMRRWQRFLQITEDVKLVTIEYDYRDILKPLVEYIEKVNKEEFPDQITTVVVPEFVPEHPLAIILHNQTASRLRSRLKQYKDIVVIDVPFHIDSQL